MKQLLQNLRNGEASVVEVPVPAARPGTALVRTANSLISAGTERMIVEFAEKSLIGKARSRPDLVRQMIDKALRDGILPTLEAAFNRLDQPMALGYSSSGTIIALGDNLQGFQIGDRVACAGGGYAVHAEYAVVPQNLMVRLPDTVDFESAAFTTLGAIALHGFRLAQPQLGERIAVIGLGLLGLLSLGIARAAGCQVLGIDLDPQRVALGMKMGAETCLRSEAEERSQVFCKGLGFDAILVCAATHSNDPIELAGKLARDRARIIAIGAVNLTIPRKLFYEKELHFQVSRSYGPGRYDPAYEEQNRDYPIGYIRWTEGRNLSAFVELLAEKRIEVTPLISHRFTIDEAPQAYELIRKKPLQPSLGILLSYPHTEGEAKARFTTFLPSTRKPSEAPLALGVLGAGNYASATFLPAIQKAGLIARRGIASASGLNAQNAARRFGFTYATSSEQEILQDPQVNVVAILTRHQHHARQTLAALRAGKHVYCEKPLALNAQELDEIQAELSKEGSPMLGVGFNRRFAPFALKIRTFLQDRSEPMTAHYRINAGPLPANHWLHDPNQGGGRLIGEGIHFIDFLTYLIGTPPIEVVCRYLPDDSRYSRDNFLLLLTFADGSLGSIAYLANGDRSFSKERLEVFCGGRIAVLEDFRLLELIRGGKRQAFYNWLRQDKGHQSAWLAFLKAIQGGEQPPISYEHIFGVHRIALIAAGMLRNSQPPA